eukprot:scaffold117564_cov32-Tisochrysis_lutea.AAC.1
METILLRSMRLPAEDEGVIEEEGAMDEDAAKELELDVCRRDVAGTQVFQRHGELRLHVVDTREELYHDHAHIAVSRALTSR